MAMISLPSRVALALLLWVAPSAGFAPMDPSRTATRVFQSKIPGLLSPLFQHSNNDNENLDNPRVSFPDNSISNSNHPPFAWWNRLCHRYMSVRRRLDTTTAAGLDQAHFAGLFGSGRTKSVTRTLVKLHDPKTYLALALAAALRWDWCWRNMFFWLAVGFCVKWYRARYVYKIPVWDRQPNWNNVITSKEQEKDLKAYTCKKCGSTIFIAKSREFFFAGNTGIGGLGCFSCGARGPDNFVMDRDRIVEDVADTDDYFDYESPLDFVTRAERKKLLKEAKGDEKLANKLLVERTNAPAGVATEQATKEPTIAADDGNDDKEQNQVEAMEESPEKAEVESVKEVEVETSKVEHVEKPKVEPEKKKVPEKKPSPSPTPASKIVQASDDDLDVLGI